MKTIVKVVFENTYEVTVNSIHEPGLPEIKLVERVTKQILSENPGVSELFGCGFSVDPKNPNKAVSYGVTRKKSEILKIEVPMKMRNKKSV